MTGQITIQHADVNSNTPVVLPASVATYTWSSLTNSTPIPGKWDIAETDVGGFENPKIVVRGTIDVGDPQSNWLTHSLLMDFAQVQFDGTSAKAIKLTIATGADGTTNEYLKGAPAPNPTTGRQYSIGGTYLDYIYVIISGFTITLSSNVEDERKWDYNITFNETKVS